VVSEVKKHIVNTSRQLKSKLTSKLQKYLKIVKEQAIKQQTKCVNHKVADMRKTFLST